MHRKVLLLTALLLLGGCGEVSGEKQTSTPLPVSNAQYLHKNAIYLPDGYGLEFSGWLRNYSLVDNAKGRFERYTFEFTDELMAIEGALYAVIGKQGYVRRVRKEEAGLLVVSYIKKGVSPITMSYESLQPSDDSQAKTRLRVTWKQG
jgi:hypothetical protein